MKDIVLRGFVDGFAEQRGLSTLDEAQLFEVFATSTILRKYHQVDMSTWDDVSLGGAGYGGIDCAAILVNGRPAGTEEDVNFFIERLRRLEVEFVFVQATVSPTFDAGKIGTFVYGVEQFFNPSPDRPVSDDVRRLRSLKDYVYSRSIVMEQNPHCSLYFASTGLWRNDAEPLGRLQDGEARLGALNLFSTVSATPIDAERLKIHYRELERGVTREIELSRLAVFPSIDGVLEAYVGLISGDQFLKLVTTDEGDLNRELFYDNVRDFQGNNPVNREISQTLSESSPFLVETLRGS